MWSANKVANALSQREDEELTQSTLAVLHLPFQSLYFLEERRLENAQLADLVQLHTQLKFNALISAYLERDGVLLFKDFFYLSTLSELHHRILWECHSSPTAGHGGIKRTLMWIAAQFYWPGLHKTVERFVAKCGVCRQIKVST